MAPLTPNEAMLQAKRALDSALEIRKQNESFMRSIGPAIVDALTPLLKQLSEKIGTLKVDVKPNVTVTPDVHLPAINIPPISVPQITLPPFPDIPAPVVTVNVPEIKIPKIEWPKDMELQGFMRLIGWDRSLLENPMPVQIRDAKGRPVDFSNLGGGAVAFGGSDGGGRGDFFTIQGFMQSAFAELMNADGRLRVSSEASGSGSGGSVFATPATADGIPYSGDNPLPVTFTASGSAQPVTQVSGASFSVEATIPNTIDVRQVSGAIWSVAVSNSVSSVTAMLANNDGVSYSGDNPVPFTAPNTLDVRQVSGANWSVSVSDIFGTTAANLVNPDGRLKVSVDVAGSGGGSVFATPATPDGVPYNSDNPQPVSATVPNTIDVRQVSGASWTVSVGPIGQGDSATALRVLLAGDSVSSVVVNNPQGPGEQATSLRVVMAGDSSASVSVRDFNGNTPATGLNETTGGVLRVVVMTDSAMSVFSIGGSTAATLLTRQANPTAVASDFVPQAADDLGRTLTRPIQVRDLMRTAYATVSNGTETTLRAGVAGAYLDLVSIMGSNASDVAVAVDIRPVTGGNIVMTMQIPASGTAGIVLQVPYPQSDTGNNWTIDMPDITGTTVSMSAMFSEEV